MITYREFERIIDEHLNKDSYIKLLKNIASNPERLTSLYRFISIKDSLYQNILQSRSIKFGYAMEAIFKQYMLSIGADYLNDNNNELNFDQLFRYNNHIVLIEQKIRDDHDSTKKRGQLQNFNNKIIYIETLYPNISKQSCMWFIDPTMNKNKTYYLTEITEKQLYYGRELSLFLNMINPNHDHKEFWDAIEEEYLIQYQSNYNAEVLLNFDNIDIEYDTLTAAEIYRLLLQPEILKILSPECHIYNKLYNVINTKRNSQYKQQAIDLLLDKWGNYIG